MLSRLIGITPLNGSRPITQKELARLYQDLPSFTQFLPFKDYDPNDAVSSTSRMAARWARYSNSRPWMWRGDPSHILKKIERGIQKALQSIPGHHDSPWILQCYLQDDPLQGLIDQICAIRHAGGEADPPP